MKKTVGALMIAVSAVAFSANANANMNMTPYVGLDYVHTRAAVKTSYRPYFNAASVNVGANYGDWFGTELFYMYSNQHKKKGIESAVGRTKADIQGYGLDLYGYLPFGCEKRFNLIATMGIGEYRVDTKTVTVDGVRRDHGWGYRFGGGASYKFTSNFGVRALYRFVEYDKIQGYDHANEYSVGVRYEF